MSVCKYRAFIFLDQPPPWPSRTLQTKSMPRNPSLGCFSEDVKVWIGFYNVFLFSDVATFQVLKLFICELFDTLVEHWLRFAVLSRLTPSCSWKQLTEVIYLCKIEKNTFSSPWNRRCLSAVGFASQIFFVVLGPILVCNAPKICRLDESSIKKSTQVRFS